MTTDDNGLNYHIDNIVLTVGSAKFRTNNAWTVNYGSNTFPTGTGTQGGADIPVSTAGTYNILLNRATGEYNFQDLLATSTFNTSNFKVYPNPTQNVWNFTSVKQAIETIQIVDVLGKTVMTVSPKELSASVDASSLTRGLYFAKIATVNATETVKLMKN